MRPIIDAHLDLSWSAIQWDRDLTLPLDALNAAERHMTDSRARGRATLTLPELRKAGVAVCLATMLARAKPGLRPAGGFDRRALDFNTQAAAYAMAQGQVAYYELLASQGHVRQIKTAADLDAHLAAWADDPAGTPTGIVYAMEGADPIVTPQQADAWFARGLRCVGLAHYGPGVYAHGTGGEGPITPAGRELLAAFERLGMILDLTHCAEPGFFEALDHFNGTVLASHNMCRALVPADRQFSDEQLKALIARGAVIGMAFDAWMLKPGWRIGETTPEGVTIEHVADHVDHICQLAGNASNVGIGTDLDGGYGTEQTPSDLRTIADIRKLADVLDRRGYSAADVDGIFFGNWLRLLRAALP